MARWLDDGTGMAVGFAAVLTGIGLWKRGGSQARDVRVAGRQHVVESDEALLQTQAQVSRLRAGAHGYRKRRPALLLSRLPAGRVRDWFEQYLAKDSYRLPPHEMASHFEAFATNKVPPDLLEYRDDYVAKGWTRKDFKALAAVLLKLGEVDP